MEAAERGRGALVERDGLEKSGFPRIGRGVMPLGGDARLMHMAWTSVMVV